ncbi:ATP-binding protein [Azospira restricta]|uniref:histidine kinase n=1 Tax=Azospira restricta TaxID=404405 RepID=A0A974PVX8_9RHOO|nr:ATP-binding protein [Azospira restricta]QRJ62487.1 HAMP domain-containing protein [Azospira restricta]
MAIQKSIVRRYLILSVLASVLPVLLIGVLYDRFTGAALEQLLGEKVATHLTATANRLASYLEARRYQVETLANYPGMAGLARAGTPASEELKALLQIESDLPDLYGILFFDADGRLQRVIPGQAASGPPYWADRPFATAPLPITPLGDTHVIGPMPAANGDSGWLLVRHPLRAGNAEQVVGYIALHVRLASLTEQLGLNPAAGALQPILQTPAGRFNAIGLAVGGGGRQIPGPDLLPGWRPLLEVEAAGVLKSFEAERRVLLVAVLTGAALVALVFYRLSRYLRRRIGTLVEGAEAIAAGELGHRIADRGGDEVATVAHAFDAMSARLAEVLEQAVRMEKLAVLGQFATGIAHEIRNPLAAIKTSVQALARREQDAKRAQLLAGMEREIDRLAGVVSDLVDFGRPRPPAPAEIAVRDALQRVVGLVAAESEGKGLQLACDADPALTLHADPDHLQQIVLNLALNALQATPAGGAVRLAARVLGDAVAIEVCDTGCGIPPELLERVSEPFFTTKTKGVGLGLSISRQLCELNGGTMQIESQADGEHRGTVVRVVLPRHGKPDADHPDH